MATVTEERTAETPRATEPEGLYEVVDGQIVEKPPMGAYQTEVAAILASRIDLFARSNGLGRAVPEMLFRLNPETNLQRRPDAAFISHERWPLDRFAPESATWDIVPDLAVEVVSESNAAGDILGKVEEYFRYGTRMVWLFYTNVQKVYVYRSPTDNIILTRSDTLDGSDIIPGFRIPLGDLFPDRSGGVREAR